jgi:D-beta-D-heptose 7-phosphate kinase/D-beta-D-heptose 1-phosphate adenosyltransferase
MDWESTDEVVIDAGSDVLAALRQGPAPDAIVLSDYAKGFLTESTLRAFIDEGRARRIPVIVDPKRADYASYRGASWVTPNLKELRETLGVASLETAPHAVAAAARPLIAAGGFEGVVVTLGEQGMVVVPRTGRAEHLRAEAREVYDVTGAGDAAVAVFALGLAAGAEPAMSARLANVAGGIVVGKVGTAVVEPRELVQALSPGAAGKLHTRVSLVDQVEWWRAE